MVNMVNMNNGEMEVMKKDEKQRTKNLSQHEWFLMPPKMRQTLQTLLQNSLKLLKISQLHTHLRAQVNRTVHT